MRILPAFGVTEGCAATAVAAVAFDSSCTRCNFADTVKTVCMRPEVGKQEGPTLLVMGLYPGSFEDRSGRPNTGKAGDYLRRVIDTYWDGRVVYDNAIRCAPKDRKPNDKHVKACRPYTHSTLVGAKPDHILCLGRWAQKTILGTSAQAEAIRNGWRWVRLDGRDVLMTFQPHPARILQNSFERRRFEQGVKRALSLDNPPKPPTDARVYVVEDADDARKAIAYLSAFDAAAFDVETSGKCWSDPVATAEDVERAEDNCMMLELIQRCSATKKQDLQRVAKSECRYDVKDAKKLIRATQKIWAPDYAFINLDPPFRFEVHSCALSALRDKERRAYVWDPWAMRDPHVRQFLVDFLAGPMPKHGANVKYDVQAFRYADGIEIPVGGDVQLERKMLNANSGVKLSELAYLVGLGGLKDAAGEELKKIQTFLNYYDKARGVKRPGEPKQWSFGLLRLDTLTVYNGRDAITTAKAGELIRSGLKHNKPIYDHFKAVVRPAIAALATVEEIGMPICHTSLEVLDLRMSTGIDATRKIIDNYCPGLNPNSTKQLQQFLFTQLKLTPIRLTDGGAWSTDKNTLTALANKHPVVSDLIRYRTLTKLHGTYVKGMFRHIAEDGRVHPTFRIDGAATGRISAENPNTMNIPRAETNDDGTATWGKLIKQCFRADDGWRILSLYYSQLEIRVAAWLSDDPEMLKAFLSGEDFHMRTAKMVSQIAWGIPPEKCTKVHRTGAKAINFGVLYGKTIKMLARDLGCTEQEAQQIYNAIMGKFVKLDAWCKARLAFARKHGYTVTYWEGRKVARRRPLPDIRSADKQRRETAERGAWNTSIQGTAADFNTAATALILAWLKKEGLRAKLIGSVHDATIFECPEEELAIVTRGARKIMTAWDTDKVPLIVDAEMGQTWGDLEKYKCAA